MSKRRKGHKKYVKYLAPKKRQRQAIHLIADLIRLIVSVFIIIYKIINATVNYVSKCSKNRHVLKAIGYSLTEIINLLYSLTPRQFEIMIAELFKNTGEYDKVEITPATNDFGRDVILTKNINGYKEITFVEVKHFIKKGMVGREIAQKLLGSCVMLKADKAIIVTTGKFHRNAVDVANKVDNLVLMDIVDIQNMMIGLDSSKMSHVIMRTMNAS